MLIFVNYEIPKAYKTNIQCFIVVSCHAMTPTNLTDNEAKVIPITKSMRPLLLKKLWLLLSRPWSILKIVSIEKTSYWFCNTMSSPSSGRWFRNTVKSKLMKHVQCAKELIFKMILQLFLGIIWSYWLCKSYLMLEYMPRLEADKVCTHKSPKTNSAKCWNTQEFEGMLWGQR